MADQLQLRGGTTAEHSTFTGALREVTVDTDKDVLVVHDNSTAGGHPLMAEDGSNSALALGSAGTPSLKFTGDTNTGVFSPAADTVGISTGGTERMRIDTSGRLLVGTSSSTNAPSGCKLIVGVQSASPRLEGNNGYGLDFVHTGVPSTGFDIGFVGFKGYTTGTTEATGAYILGEADGNWATGSAPMRLVFSTTADGASSPTERMRINEKGAFKASNSGSYTGATSAYHEFYQTENTTGLYIRATNGSYASNVLEINGDRTTTNATYNLINAYNGAISGQLIVRDSGNVVNTNNSYGAISDIRLKENIVNANSQWDDLKALQVRNYNFKKGQTHTQIGLIAQEVELVSPGLVSESPDRDKDGNDLGTVTKSVNYSVLYMKAVKALQEAMERIETLEGKVAALETP